MDDKNQTNKLLVHAYIDAINCRDWAMLDNIVAEDFARHSFAGRQPKCEVPRRFNPVLTHTGIYIPKI